MTPLFGSLFYPSHYCTAINEACQRSLESQAVSYQVVSRFAEEIRVPAEIQQQIQFTQEREVLRPLLDYQKLLQEVKNGCTHL